jgi:hypothetical protein
MLVLNNAQMLLLRAEAMRSFERELVTHLFTFAPVHCKVIGSFQVTKAVQLGLKRSEAHGLTKRGPQRFYCELMFTLGSDFDSDPQYAWAREILARRDIDEMARADQLYRRVDDFIERTFGRDGQIAARALRALADLPTHIAEIEEDALVMWLSHAIHGVYPEKCAWLGERPIAELAKSAAATAQAYFSDAPRGVGLCIVLAFSFGHGFADDLLLPWISRTINDRNMNTVPDRVARLERRMYAYLRRVIASMDRV